MKAFSVRALALIIFSVAMSMLVVHKRAQITRARYEIGRMERKILRFEKEEQELKYQLSQLKAPHVIAAKVENMELGLIDPLARERAMQLARRRAQILARRNAGMLARRKAGMFKKVAMR